MYEFHGDKKRYFEMTYSVTKNHVIPFLKSHNSFSENMNVLEIGCGEAGVLKAFTELGCHCTGIELENYRLDYAREFMKDELASNKVQFLCKDIYDVNPEVELGTKFDLIILKDVIEHIPNQEKFIPQLHRFLKDDGFVFYAFPPWMMPYGGHQQVLPKKIASKLPYYHLLPGKLYPITLKLLGVNDSGIKTMEEIRDTGISIERFVRLNKQSGFSITAKKFYLFNPIYEFKFGIKPRIQSKWMANLPWLRNFFTMGVYFLCKKTPEIVKN